MGLLQTLCGGCRTVETVVRRVNVVPEVPLAVYLCGVRTGHRFKVVAVRTRENTGLGIYAAAIRRGEFREITFRCADCGFDYAVAENVLTPAENRLLAAFGKGAKK
ncbi:MAG: hypothetical protein JXL80_07675 [Planctomycetes bacterium]|nr:hypothetical protein [Planctomycetota bacterium]